MITPLVAIASRAALYPIQSIIVVGLLVSGAYFRLLDIARNSPSSTNTLDPLSRSAVQSTIWARKNSEGWKWTFDAIMDTAKDGQHVELAWGQIGISTSEPVLETLNERLQGLAHTSPATSPCFPVNNKSSAPCLVNLLSTGETKELGVLLQKPYISSHNWQAFVISLELPNTEIVPLDNQDATDSNGSAAGNLIWLFRSIGRTYSRTRELLNNAPAIDIVIMVIGYLTMHFTFITLFLNMRTLGSKFWLATTVLISSTFSFLLALATVDYFGVPIDMVLISEGLPFLVVTVGFEKPFILTKAVLQGKSSSLSRPIKDNVNDAVREKGPVIVRDYLVEIAVLVLGYASGVTRLRQFCFLAAWILGWDCVLLFTFYTAILSIKLEIKRIKRHTDIRKTLQEEGIAYGTAEKVAAANDSKTGMDAKSSSTTFLNFFGPKIKDSTVTRFKLFMVSSFVLVNLLNLYTLPFRPRSAYVNTPFHLAEEPSEATLNLITSNISAAYPAIRTINLSVLPPLFLRSSLAETDGILGKSGRVVDGFLKGWTRRVGDPVISKWIVIILCVSMGLNAWLLSEARRGALQPVPQEKPISVIEAEKAVQKPATDLKPISGKPLPKVPAFVLDDSESGDDEKHLAHVKRHTRRTRSASECMKILSEGRPKDLLDEEITALTLQKKIPLYALEKSLKDLERAVKIRRAAVSRESITTTLESSGLPYKHYDYARVMGACCENVIGYIPIPVGVAGPCLIDGEEFWLPMATTEGCLVASTMRGAKAMNAGGGVTTSLSHDGMTRGPCVKFPTVSRAGAAKRWLDSEDGLKVVKRAFDSTSRFARLLELKTAVAGNRLFIRFSAFTGDGMGMNMISKGVEHALAVITNEAGFGDMEIISISGNFCTDKKPAAVNWILGRGKSVVAEAIVPANTVRTVLKSSVDEMVQLNIEKNLIGSAIAGSIGGFNAHAANLVTAVFIATGQDPAQNVESSNCMTLMDKAANGDLHIMVTMPSIEVGTIGGGTILEPQAAMLDMLGVRGPHPTSPGANAQKLARIVAATVLAGELSLCAALAAGHLVKSHMAHNRSAAPTPVATRSTTPAPALAPPHIEIPPLTQLSSTNLTPPKDNPILGSCIKS